MTEDNNQGRRLGTSLVLGAAMLPLIAYGMLWWSARTDALLLQDVEVTGLQRTQRAEVLAAADLDRPRNLLGLQNEAVERGVLALPWVRALRVERVGYQRLRIEIQEAEPRLVAIHGDREVWMDEEGQPILVKPLTLDVEGLPLVTGVLADGDASRADGATLRLLTPRVNAALALLAMWERIEHEVGRVETVHVLGVSRLDVETVEGVRIRLRTDALSMRLARVVDSFAVLRERGLTPDVIVLDGRDWNWIAVRPSGESVR